MPNHHVVRRHPARVTFFLRLCACCLAIALALPITTTLAPHPASAAAPEKQTPLLTQKKAFTLPQYTTVHGENIKNIRIGYETYGTLNADKSNAILICHFFSGNSHAAGKYHPSDATAGYWDNIIGPGKAIDTNTYFVISSDTLVNLGAHNPNVITTGPASINPDTGKPYGTTFPLVTIADFVHVQKALLTHFGIKKLHGVAGASMGSLQALTWAAEYPDMVPRVMAVISPGAQGHPYTIALLKRWADVIRLDPNWKNGAYYNSTPPTRGLDLALQSVTLDAFQTGWVEKYGTTWADQEQDPTQQLAARYAVEKMLDDRGAARAATSDANHFLYLVKASQSFDISKDVNNLKAKFLFLPAEGDLIFPPAQSQAFAARLKAQGNDVAWHLLKGPLGHINGVALMPQASTHIQNWLK